jgi:hypothetical protein
MALSTILEKFTTKDRGGMTTFILTLKIFRILKDMLFNGSLNANDFWLFRKRILAQCVKASLGTHAGAPTYDQILAMVGEEPNSRFDEPVDFAVRWALGVGKTCYHKELVQIATWDLDQIKLKKASQGRAHGR